MNATKPQIKVVAWGGVDEVCQWCSQPAKMRLRDDQGIVRVAACPEHRLEYRDAVLQLLSPVKL